MSKYDIRKAIISDAQDIGSILGDAFKDDPVMNFSLGSRIEVFRWYFKLVFEAHYSKHEEVYIADDLSSAAMWLPPGIEHQQYSLSLQLLLLREMILGGGIRGAFKLTKLTRYLKKMEPKEFHYYLHAIGVTEGNRGKGFGSQLLHPVLEKCDRDNQLAYLENTNEKNLPLYERNGFEVLDVYEVDRNGPRLWPMLRKPKRA